MHMVYLPTNVNYIGSLLIAIKHRVLAVTIFFPTKSVTLTRVTRFRNIY
jgi:hypothetical protein